MTGRILKAPNISRYFLYVAGITLLGCFFGLQIIAENYEITAISILGLVALLLILKSPIFGLYLILVLTPLNQLQQFDIPLFSSAIRIIGLVTLASFLAHYFVFKEYHLVKTELFFPLAIFVSSYIVGLNRANDLEYVLLETVPALIMYFMLYLLVVNLVKDQETVKKIFLLFTIVASGLALFGIAQYFKGETLFHPEMGKFAAFDVGSQSVIRVIGVFRNPNAFAYTYVLVIPLMVGILLTAKRRLYRWIIIGLLGICTFCLLLTYSRSAFLALLVSVFIFIISSSIKWRQKITAIMGFLGIFIMLHIFLPDIFNVLRYRIVFAAQSTGIQQRIELVKGGIDTFLTYPFIGGGTGNASIILGKYTHRFRCDPHNNLTAVLIETGLLGFIPFVLIFVNFTKKVMNAIYKTSNQNSRIILVSILASIWGYFVNGLFHTSINYALWWMVLGLGMAQANIAERSLNETVQKT